MMTSPSVSLLIVICIMRPVHLLTPPPFTTTTTPTPPPDTTTTTPTPPPDTTTTTPSPPPDTTTTTPTPPPDTTTTTPTPPPDTTTTTPTPPPDTTTTTPTPAPDTTTTTPAASPMPSPSPYPSPSPSPSPATTADPGCNQALTAVATTQYFTSLNYPYNYDSNMNCEITITSPTDTAIVLTFSAFSFEYDRYCTYDNVAVYEYSTADGSTTLIGTYCGTTSPGTIQSSSNGMKVVIYSDGSIQSSGTNVGYNYVDNSYPGCKSGYTTYTAATLGKGTAPTIANANKPYLSNQDEYFLITNPGGTLVLQLTEMNLERGSGCIYDRLIIYNGACTKDTILDTHCGTFLKRWEITAATSSEYLVQFHSDGSINKNGFTLQYFLGTPATGAPTTTTTTIGPPVSAEVNLINDVLTNYSSANFPVRNLSYAVEATVDLFLAGVSSLDEVQQKLTTTMQFKITWSDDSMKWPTTKLSGISKILMPQNDLWKPDLALLNSFTKLSSMGSKFMFIVVENTGLCTWKPYQILESTCQADMTNYPYDTQNCDLMFSTWSSTTAQVQTIIGTSGMQRHENFVENSEWKLEGISQRNETVNGQLAAVFTLTLKRNHAFVVFYVTVPVILLSLLNALTFALPVSAGEKSGFAITVFLSFLIYVIVTFQKMPDSSDTISLFAVYLLIMTGLSNLTVIISVLEIRMIELKTKHKPLPQCTISFTKWILNLQHKMLCITNEMDEKRYAEAQNEARNVKPESEDDGDVEEDDTAWPEFVSALDFTCFWVFFLVTVLLAVCYMTYLATR